MGRCRALWRWLADRLATPDDPSQPEALQGSPLDLARALELAVDHCSLTPDLAVPPPPDSPTDGQP